MSSQTSIFKFVELIQKIYTQGELNPFIQLVQSDSRILLYLFYHPSCHPSDISKSLNMSRPNVTANLKNLEDNEMIVRTLNAKNRREIYVTLTAKGMQEFNNRMSKIIGLFQDWLKLLGEEETEHLIRILEISSDMNNIGEAFKKYVTSEGKESW